MGVWYRVWDIYVFCIYLSGGVPIGPVFFNNSDYVVGCVLYVPRGTPAAPTYPLINPKRKQLL